MRMYVIANGEGEILGTAPIEPVQTEGEAPTHISLIPEPGQMIYEVEMPDKIIELPAAELHARYRVEVKRVVAELVELEKR